MTIESIVNVQISRSTASVTQKGFGTGNFLSNDASFSGRIKEYASLTELTQDTQSGADAQLFASKYFGQQIKPQKLFITKKMNDRVEVRDLSFDADFIASNDIDLTINAVGVTQTPFTTDQATTLALLATNIQAHADVATAVVTGARIIRITGATIGLNLTITALAVTGGASQASGTDSLITEADTVGTDVASIQDAILTNDEWYALASHSRVKADIELMAAYIQGLVKIYISVSEDSDVISSATTDVATALKSAGYDRTAIFFSRDEANFPEGGLMGRTLPLDPGSLTWKFKTLAGVTIDVLQSGEISNATGKNANVYTEIGGVNMFQNGTMASGEFIDVIRGVDWLQSRITESVFSNLVNNEKVPFTNDGINTIVNAVSTILKQAVARDVLTNDPEPKVTAPLVSEVSVADRIARNLPDVNFTGVLAGAIHSTTINGNVSV